MDRLNEQHEWDADQVHGNGGCIITSRTCEVCGLKVTRVYDQNDGSTSYSYATHNGDELTLREAVEYEC